MSRKTSNSISTTMLMSMGEGWFPLDVQEKIRLHHTWNLSLQPSDKLRQLTKLCNKG
jgi:hypothetical protein